MGEVYDPKPNLVTVTEEASTYEPPVGKEVHPARWLSKEEEIAAGYPPTSHYTASGLIQQLNQCLDARDSEAGGPDGYYD